MTIAERLKGRVTGRITVPEDADYDTARAVRNGRIDKHPALIVYAESVADVLETVRFAREESLPLSVRGAGYHITGACVAESGIVLDTCIRLTNTFSASVSGRQKPVFPKVSAIASSGSCLRRALYHS